MLLPRLLTSCRNSSNHFSTLPTTSHLLSTFLNVLHLCAHLLDSPQLSFHLSLSSLLKSFQLVLRHLTSVPLVQFFSARLKWRKRSFSAQLNCISIRPIRLTHSSCGRLISRYLYLRGNYPSSIVLSVSATQSLFQLSLVLSFSGHVLLSPVSRTFKHAWAAAIFLTRAKRCDVTSRHLSRARVSSTAARFFECGLRRQHSRAHHHRRVRSPSCRFCIPACAAYLETDSQITSAGFY